ncbi:gamma-aminobutyric acid receptor alpha-like isoform X2 [Penaeus japonicus]|uniref:gamma-aminobutyric acid receptor alpha-like isoform X2 n=1 Tax=Penaeus japonicus TaxID=27405 RepID=UPI001C70C529|nr:gamma-aminobutyric acid receptor alpha-like isoform X2 [Penaeus japonicus]
MKKIHRSVLAIATFLLASIFSQCKVTAVQSTIRPTSFTHSRKNLPQYSFRGGNVRPITPTKNISSLLDNLLKDYDQKLRPSFGGKPTTIEIDIEVRSMSQISEMDMTYSMDCYFRQSWVDERLAFSDLDEAFTLSVAVLEKLWKPDTFIYNGKRSHVHLITTPNKFIRLYQNGRILYSSRMTINAICPMNLHDFPMDTQHCPLRLGSFAYTTRDVLYKWNRARQVVIAPDLMLSQFDLIAAPSGTENTTRRGGEFSTLMASFYLQRNMGNFLIQVYGPCMLLVVLSWVSFWLNREATSDRISLGITTVLTMTFLGLEARTDLPKVSYSTALDLFVWLSYGFIFATIIEFAFVHVFTKVGSGEVYLSEPSSLVGSDGGEMEWDEESETVGMHSLMTTSPGGGLPSIVGPNGMDTSASSPATSISSPPMPRRSSICSRISPTCPRTSVAGRLASLCRKPKSRSPRSVGRPKDRVESLRRRRASPRREVPPRRSFRHQQMNSVSNIDEISRVLFPVSFICINFIYWYTFLSNSQWPVQ